MTSIKKRYESSVERKINLTGREKEIFTAISLYGYNNKELACVLRRNPPENY